MGEPKMPSHEKLKKIQTENVSEEQIVLDNEREQAFIAGYEARKTGEVDGIIKSPQEIKENIKMKSLAAMLSRAQEAIELYERRGGKIAKVQFQDEPIAEFFDELKKKGYETSVEFGSKPTGAGYGGPSTWECYEVTIKWE